MKCFVFVLGLTLCVATAALAADYVEKYEMDYAPDVVAGTVNGHVMSVADGTGSTFLDGIMTFLDDSASGDYGFYINDDTLFNGGNYTVDMRVKWLQGCNGDSRNGQRSMTFCNGVYAGSGGVPSNQGRALRLDGDQHVFVGNGTVGTWGALDMTDWVDLRVIVTNTGGDNGTGMLTTYQLGSDTALASAFAGSSSIHPRMTAAGIALGSISGGLTRLTEFQLDWVRIAQGIDPLAEYAPVPEPSSLLALFTGLGGLGGLMWRRRR